MTNIDAWGPWAPGLNVCEFTARTRSLRAIAHCLAGPRANDLCEALRIAEDAPWQIEDALAELNRLASRDLRAIVAAFGWVSCPNWSR